MVAEVRHDGRPNEARQPSGPSTFKNRSSWLPLALDASSWRVSGIIMETGHDAGRTDRLSGRTTIAALSQATCVGAMGSQLPPSTGFVRAADSTRRCGDQAATKLGIESSCHDTGSASAATIRTLERGSGRPWQRDRAKARIVKAM